MAEHLIHLIRIAPPDINVTSTLTGFQDECDIRIIRTPKHSLRTDLGPLEGLMASILEKGLLCPIVVRPVDGGFEVVAGNRRLEAFKRLRLRQIPCFVVEMDDKDAFETSLVENVQHQTLDPIDEARAFKRYIDGYGYGGVSELATRIGKSQPYVSRRVALLNLPRKMQDKIMRRRISPSLAQELLPLREEEREELADIIVGENFTRRELRRIIRHKRDLKENWPAARILPYAVEQRRQRSIEKSVDKCIVAMKICLTRMSEAIDELGDEEIVKDTLLHRRIRINSDVSFMYKMKKKLRRYLACEMAASLCN